MHVPGTIKQSSSRFTNDKVNQSILNYENHQNGRQQKEERNKPGTGEQNWKN